MKRFTTTLKSISIAFLMLFSFQESYAQCGPGQSSVTFTLDMTNDNFPGENAWKLVLTQSGFALDSACFNSYTGGVQTVTACLDTGLTYSLYAYDSWGDGLDGAEYRIEYTYGPGIDTIGADQLNIPSLICGVTEEMEDSTSFYVTYIPAPSCLAPTSLTSANISQTSVDLGWTENSGATEWQIEYGPMGYTLGNGIDSIVTSNPKTVSGLMPNTNYDYYVRSICAVGDTGAWSVAGSFKTLFQCPAGAVCATYTTGPIQTDRDFTALPDTSTCIGIINLTIPAGNQIDSLSTQYDMTASTTNNAWMSEQRSWLYSPNTLSGEPSVTSGAGGSPGTFNYSRQGLSFANGANGTVAIEMHAGRSFGGSGCGVTYSQVDSATWVVVAYYSLIPACPTPNALVSSAIDATSTSIDWTENGTATEWEVEYDTSGFTQGTGNRFITTTKPDTLTGLSAQTTYDWYVRSICGPGDTSAWSSAANFLTPCLPIATFPYFEGFESGVPPTCWSESILSGTSSWTSNNGNQNSSVSAYAGSSNAYFYSGNYNGDASQLISPNFDLTSLTTPRLEFWHTQVDWSSDQDTLGVYYRVSPTDPWVYLTSFTTSITSWSQVAIDLPNASSTYSIMLEAYSGYGRGVTVDNFEIKEAPLCPSPTALASSNPSGSIMSLSWTENGTATEWQIEYDTAGFTQGTGTIITTTTNPDTLTGLSPLTSYDWYVRSICSSADTSGWSASSTFLSPCGAFIAPYTETFDNSSIPNCWSQSSTSGGPWTFGTPGFSWNTSGCSFTPADHTGNSGNYAAMDHSGTDAGVILEMPDVDVSGLTVPFLEFYHVMCGAGYSPINILEVEAFDGSSWNSVGTIQQGTSGWEPFGFNLSSHVYNTNLVKIRFRAESGGSGSDFYGDHAIDDVSIDEIPSCPNPANLSASNTTPSSVVLAWLENGSATNWEIEYGPTGYTQGNGTNIFVTSNPDTITGLSAATNYDWYVRSVCSVGDTSAWIGPNNFTTPCVPLTAPYFNDFETDALDEPPLCWLEYKSYSNGFVEVEDFTGTAAPFSGSQALYIYSSSGFTQGVDTLIAITPQFSDLDAGDKQIRFQGNSDDPSTQLIVGTVSSPSPSATFNPIDTITFLVADTYQEVTVPFTTANGYNGTDEYIVLAHDLTNTFDYIRIDNFNYEVIPTCPNPTALAIDSLDDSSVSLSWTAGGTETEWQIEYDTAGFAQGTGNFITVTTNSNSTVSGLLSATNYDFYVRAVCAVGDSSLWTPPVTISTFPTGPSGVSCSVGLPATRFTEEFDGVNGWTGDIGTGGGNWEIPGGPTSTGTGPASEHSGPAGSFASFEASGAGTVTASLVSPAINLSASGTGTAELSFWMHAFGGDIGTLNVGVSTSATGPFTTEFTWSGQLQTAETDPWANIGVDLSSYIGQTIYLEFSLSHFTTGFEGDLAIDLVEVGVCSSCPVPTNLNTSNPLGNSLNFNWTENGTATEWQIEYDTSGFVFGTGIDSIVNTNPSKSINNLTPETSYDFYVRSVCSPGDSSIWAGPFTAVTPCATITAPYTMDFTVSGTSTPDCWNQLGDENWLFRNSGTGHIGNVGTLSGTTPSGGYFAWVDDSSPHNIGTTLESPLIDVSSLTSPRLSFYMISDNEGDSRGNTDFHVDVWDGSQWNDSLFFSDTNTLNGAWENIIVDLSQLTITGPIQLRFVVDETNGTGFDDDRAIDDIVVEDVPQCPSPSSLADSATSATAVDISWTSGGASDWNVEYGPAGFTQGNGTRLTTTSTTVSISGLTSNLAYEVYVRDSCGAGNTSNWVGPFTFGSVVPCDDFDIYNTGSADPQSVLINSWAGAPEDAEISTDFASSGSNSLKIHETGTNTFSDVVAQLGVYNTGTWNMAVDLYIPSGNGGYYNILHNYVGSGTNVWAIEVTLDSNGTATVEEGTNGTATIGTFNYTPGSWNTIEHIIDLDNDTAYILVNGVDVNVGWQFSLGSANFGDQFNAMNFFSTAPTGQTPLAYFDNFCLTPYVIPTPIPYYPIGTINTEDANGVADSLNVACQTSGTVVGVDRRGNGYEFALIDMSSSSQEGIVVFRSSNLPNYTNPTEGDSLLIYGTVSQFNGLTQIEPDSIVVISTGATVPSPIPVSSFDETTESKLLSIQNFVLLDSSASGSYNMEAFNGTDTITIRVDADTDVDDSLDVPSNKLFVGDTICSLIGVGGQFDFNSPFTDGYQVFPNRYADLTICKLPVGIAHIDRETAQFSIYPNPTRGDFRIETSGFDNSQVRLSIRDISGRVILEEVISNANSQFRKDLNLSDNAKGMYFITIVDGEKQINRKLIIH